MCVVKKGLITDRLLIPEEGKWVKAKEEPKLTSLVDTVLAGVLLNKVHVN